MKIILALILINTAVAKSLSSSSEEVNFQSIKNILKNDLLQERAAKKTEDFKKVKRDKTQFRKAQYNYPKREDFWNFFSEFWLVKNVQKLKWDFKKPDYGLHKTIGELFERFGFFERKFKLLLLNDFSVTHMALPGSPAETILILSVPFMRTLDLTKREIAVLLMEDYIRLQMGYFVDYVMDKKLQQFIGGNFAGKKADRMTLDQALARANEFIFKRGFNFQQQFKVTQKMSSLLRSDSTYWDSYLSLLHKIDKLVKSDKLYQNYTRIYPAPEIQIKWILPENKVL